MFELSFYLIFAVATGLASFIIIPKNLYKKFFLYGLLFGGIGDTAIASLIHSIGFINYKNMGVTNIFGIFSFWTPITWAFAYMLYFYFLPVRKYFLVPYIILFATLNYSVGIVMSQSGLLEVIGIFKYIQPLVFLVWSSISAWIFHKSEHRVMV
ncbi:hypothetical protein [Desulfosporosinus lacus]|uniref:DUF2878 domain-containing protein n=1 Tax=Desulfosporosinus lacus DSM 15449 TaxID=1121420 RepID=A0A1M5ZBA8_9FIRM|nr:hypothetical protein [Desulfosporosinus lacus]SHI21438.1 hypothetical protein SAMN02746098_03100 [Desulfosporosinus lacus DSM 15449]